VLVLTVIAAGMLSVLYLMIAKPVYTSKATLRVLPMDPGSISSGSSNNNNTMDDTDFLNTECVVIQSNAVLALAMDKIADTRTLKGVPHPMDYLKLHLQAEPSKKGQAIDVTFDSHYMDDANGIVDAVVAAYKEYESNSWKEHTDKIISTLTQGSQGQQEELNGIEKKISDITKQMTFVPDMDPAMSPQHQEVTSLREAKRKAELDQLRAESAYTQAGKSIIGRAELLEKVASSETAGAYLTNPEEQLQKYQQQLAIEEAKLMDDKAHFGVNNPVIITDQSRVNDMIVATVVAAHEWVETAKTQVDAFDSSLKKAEQAESSMVASQNEYHQLQSAAERLRKNSEDLDNRRGALDITKGAGALNIDVLNPGEQFGKPRPEAAKTLLIGLVLGVIAGTGFACVRDWTDDRIRTPGALRAAVGAQVLGAIPVITTAYTSADRGQIVHHEPFGDAAESYRLLRTALQFGLPTGTKTLLVTSPVSGDGKSTFVSNLGIVMAQAQMRVLIIDADLRAPMQHRLFGLKDRMGLSTVLGGADTPDHVAMQQAIQQTMIPGLDVLPCGPAPLTPAEMLNSPLFAEHLEALAEKYDLVILDSPPLTAVADARILAACADMSLLVIRLETSNRRHVEAAREGLRSVGARLVGVAVNGVVRNSGFGGATGYYPYREASAPVFSKGGLLKTESKSSSDVVA
jgi:capsular exopolysaccharide synthesis family protein